MHTTKLRKVGGSVMLAVPPAVLELLDLRVGEPVDLAVENGQLVVEPRRRKRYSLEELLEQCDANAPLPSGDGWTDSAPVGRELI